MVINKLTKRWLDGGALNGSYLISVGQYKGEKVLFISWPQERDVVLTVVRYSDTLLGDPVRELFEIGVDPDWNNQDQFPVQLRYLEGKPYLDSPRYRLNEGE